MNSIIPRGHRTAMPFGAMALLVACGGGGSGGGSNPPPSPPPPPPTFTIGGTVTGLTAGELVLQNNAGNNLTISSNGSFTFSTPLAGGTAYAVSVLTQPPGPDCVVTAGTGTANANVTGVAVVCTAAATTHFVPFTASPPLVFSETSELHVVSSKSIARAPIKVAEEFQSTVGYTLMAGNPVGLLYEGVGADNQSHIYSLDLTGTSSLVPRQLSSQSFPYPSTVNYCEAWRGYTDADDPQSGFLLLGLPTSANLCGGGDFAFLRIRLSDSATTAPVPMNDLVAGNKHFLYRPDGTLAGTVLAVNPEQRLVMYHDDSFTTSTVLLEDCIGFMVLPMGDGSWPGPSWLSLQVENTTYAFLAALMTDGSTKLFRVDHTRAISPPLLDVPGDFDGFVRDADYFYFLIRGSTLPYNQELFRVRLDGTAPAQLLYSYLPPDGDSGFALAGVTDTALVLQRTLTIDPMNGERSADLRILDKDGPGTPTVIASYTDAPVNATLFKNRLFIQVTHLVPGANPAFTYSTEIRNLDGSIAESNLPLSAFVGGGLDGLRRVRHIAVGGVLDGAIETISAAAGGALTFTTLKQPDGADFHLSADTTFAFTIGLTANISAGTASDNDKNYGLIVDEVNATAAPVNLPGNNVGFPMP